LSFFPFSSDTCSFFTQWDAQVLDFAKEIVLNRNHHGCKSFITGGNSIGGFTSMQFAACDTASIETGPSSLSSRVTAVSSSGAAGTNRCTGLVLMNSAGPVFTKQEIDEVVQDMSTTTNSLQKRSVAQRTAMDALPPCSPPPRPVMRAIGNGLLAYLRPSVQSICKNLYPTNPAAVDDVLCQGILRDSLDPGAIYVMMAGAKLPMPRSANELLNADFRPGGSGSPSKKTSSSSSSDIAESTFDGPVLVAQGILDPLSDCNDRMKRFGALRKGIDMDPINAGHCPHDELPDQVAGSISKWMLATKEQRRAFIKISATPGAATPVVTSS
jgi:pimeloyl-ACP methyl ester carboxylesterase